jgi:SHS2 domain-containing protein
MRELNILDHTADIMIEGIGETLEEAFEGIALALVSVMVDMKSIKNKYRLSGEVKTESRYLEDLLVDFLNKLIFLKDAKKFIFNDIEVRIKEKGNSLVAKFELKGDYYTGGEYEFSIDVKGASYSAAKVEKISDRYICRCVVDV